jgi:integrase
MTKLHLKFVQSFGGYHYFRRPGFPRIRLPGFVGSEAFMQAYQQALGGAPEPIGASRRSKPGSVSAAIASYYGSPTFRVDLASTSQEMRRATLEAFRRQHGDKLIGAMPKKFLQALLDNMSPAAARNWLNAIRALMKHCIRLELVRDDPTLGIKLRPMRSDGHHTWTEDQITQFEAHHPIGSKPRLALALGLHTGQRRGDVVRMGRQHIRNGLMHVRQQKTGTTLAIPVHVNLQALLDATARDGLTFLTANNGRPFVAKSFSDWFRTQCDRAGLPPECSFHGLRKAACVGGSRRRAARPPRSPPSPVTRRCARSSATPRAPIRNDWPATPWRARPQQSEREQNGSIHCQRRPGFDNFGRQHLASIREKIRTTNRVG